MNKNQTVLLELSVYSLLTLLLIAESITNIYGPFSIISTLVISFFAMGRLTILNFSSTDEGNPISNVFDFYRNLSSHVFSTLLSISLISLFSLFLGLNGAYSISIVTTSVCLYTSLLIFLVGKRYSLSFSDAANLVKTPPIHSLKESYEYTTKWQKVYFIASLVILSSIYLDSGENSGPEKLEFSLLSETGNIDDLRGEFQVGETVTLFAEINGKSEVELTFLCTITNMENGESEEIYSDNIIIEDGASSVPLSINLLSEGPRLLNFYLYSDGSNEPIRDLYYSFEVVQ